MGEPVSWLSVLDVLAKVAAAAGLFAYLLNRGGVRPIAAMTVTLALLLALFYLSFTGPGRLSVTIIAFMACTYVVLAIERSWTRAGIIAGCFIAFGLIRNQDAVVLFLQALSVHDRMGGFLIVVQMYGQNLLTGMTSLALWTGFMVILRGWARGRPRVEESPARPARDDV
jgi:hypothetical protein